MSRAFLIESGRGSALGYALSFVALVAAVVLRWALDPILGDTLPLVTLYGAIAAAVWVGGLVPALAVTLVGYVACAFWFMEPRGAIDSLNVTDSVGIIAYLFTSAAVIAVGEGMHRARARAASGRELLRVTFSSIGDAVITTDVAGRVTYLNQVAERATGWSFPEALGQPLPSVFRIVNESTRRPADNPALRSLREGVVVGLANHTLLIRKDGSEIPIDDSAAPIRDETGKVSGCVLIFRDVTEQRRAEQEKTKQLAAARLLASIVESSEVAIVSKSLDGIIETWNAAAERLFGHSAEYAIGRHISLVIPPERLREEDQIIESLKAGRRVEHFETERVGAGGKRLWVSLSISPVLDDAGKVIGASKMVRDLTDYRAARMERERFSALIESSTDFVGISDLDGVPLYVNHAGLELVGLESMRDPRMKTVWDFFFPEDVPRIRDELFPAVIAVGHAELEVRFRHFGTGEPIWVMYKIIALRDDDGRVVAIGTVSTNITSRKRLEDDLRDAVASLAEANARKNEFLATLAHELRGPLAPLSNVLEVWKRVDDPAALARSRATMERQLAQLVRLVDDLLDLNRITHNRLELRRTRVQLADVVHQAVEASRPLADSLGHELDVRLPDTRVWLNADPVRLAQVFGNLLNNACKYTPPGGWITLNAELDGDHVVVSVRDTGAGIPAEQLSEIFDMFVQVNQSLDRTQGGLGIGLTLVKRLVTMHGGTVQARSDGPLRGSEFIVRLPVQSGEEVSEPSSPELDEPLRGRKILIVDDNRDSAESLAMLLEIEGNEVFTAHDGEQALKAIEAHRPEAVLLDIGLPKINGYEVARRVRAEPWGRDVVLIALTGWGQEEDRRKSHDAGFDGHLVKPADPKALAQLLQSLLPARAGRAAEQDAPARA